MRPLAALTPTSFRSRLPSSGTQQPQVMPQYPPLLSPGPPVPTTGIPLPHLLAGQPLVVVTRGWQTHGAVVVQPVPPAAWGPPPRDTTMVSGHRGDGWLGLGREVMVNADGADCLLQMPASPVTLPRRSNLERGLERGQFTAPSRRAARSSAPSPVHSHSTGPPTPGGVPS